MNPDFCGIVHEDLPRDHIIHNARITHSTYFQNNNKKEGLYHYYNTVESMWIEVNYIDDKMIGVYNVYDGWQLLVGKGRYKL